MSDSKSPPPASSDHTLTETPMPEGGRHLLVAQTSTEFNLTTIPGYEPVAVLGRGGMGVVYKALQTRLKRHVALKVVIGGTHAGSTALQRFRAEAEAVAALQHPNIVQIYDYGDHDGMPYLAMEFAGGGTLKDRIAGGVLPTDEAASLVAQIARGLAAAHQHGIVHRDIKPANILFTEDGTPKIADFGLAKRLEDNGMTATGAVLGSPSYMAPEQASGKPKLMGPHTDVYALGALLYECLTGRPPFVGESMFDALYQVQFGTLVPPRTLRPSVPPALEAICLKCLERKPADRAPSAAAVAEALEQLVHVEAPPPIPPRRRSRPLVLGLLGVGLGVSLAVGGWALLHKDSPPPNATTPAAAAASNLHVLLVGVNSYPNLDKPEQSLVGPERDVKALAVLLRKVADPTPKVTVLTRGAAEALADTTIHPSAEKVNRHLTEIIEQSQPEDVVIVALSGRGSQNTQTGEFEFWPEDVTREPKSRNVTGAILASQLVESLTKSRAKAKVLLIDTRRDDYHTNNTGPSAKTNLRKMFQTPEGIPIPRNIAVLFGCSPGELAGQTTDGSLFTSAVTKGVGGAADINHDGVMSLRELMDFVAKEVRERATLADPKSPLPEQHPELIGDLSPDTPLVRFRAKGESAQSQ